MGDSRLLDCNAPGFIKRYFETSRLHHLSTWKADIADFVIGQMSAKRRSPPFKASKIEEPFRTIMHIDMDCFFASVGVRDRPHLLGKPVAVAHSQGGVTLEYSTSEIASCNYEARAKGVKNGIFIGSAKELAPDLVIIPYEFEQYDACSKFFYHTLLGSADFVQSVSCDEAFVDVTFCMHKRLMKATGLTSVVELQAHSERDVSFLQLYESTALDIANEMREEIHNQTRCHASVGIANNILLARIATSKAKPNGVYSLLQHGKALLHLKDLPIRGLPGVGRSTSDKCAQLQLLTCGDVQAGGERSTAILAQLRKELGEKTGENLYDFCWGRDERVLENKPRQSVGSDINWGIRFVNNEQVEHFLKEYCAEVYDRLDKTMHTAGHVTVNVKKKLYEGEPGKFLGCGHCLDLSRSAVPGRVIASADALFKCVSMLYKEIGLPPEEVRGVGIHLKKLQPRQTTGGSFFKAIAGATVTKDANWCQIGAAPREVVDGLAFEEETNRSTDTSIVALKEQTLAPNIRNYFHTPAFPGAAALFEGNSSPVQEPQSMSSAVSSTISSANEKFVEGTGTQNSESDQDSRKIEQDYGKSSLVYDVSTSPSPGDDAQSLQAAMLRSTTTNNSDSAAAMSMDDVDLDVFMALPEDIQRELQRAFESTSSAANSVAAAGVSGVKTAASTAASSRPSTAHKKGVSVQGSSPPSKRTKTSSASAVGSKKIASQGKAVSKTGGARQPSITSIWGSK
eukprot:gene12698-14671_t